MINQEIYKQLIQLTRENGTEAVMEGFVLWSLCLNDPIDLQYIIDKLEIIKEAMLKTRIEES